ncbi:HlyD family secretion protein [Sphingomonas sp. IC-56]|uniref:HlyD family secretion protein n=1 Tax=Sphingomonas sp. IC-56 TaxID=2898529 RepID=UPI001E401015|nr:HlyD family secretion protein [Sphingomonas sp. IC-56]MCD2322955.1 HlyD family secretion protein [Sphingomonas sp. IC-56]
MAERAPPSTEAEPVDQATAATTEGGDPPPAPAARRWHPPRPGAGSLIIAGVILLAAAIAILMALRAGPFATDEQSTENAYVRGQVTIISPQVSGYVVDVPVQDFAQVRAGAVLARIDDRIYRQRVDQALASVANQRAQLANSTQAAASRAAGVGSQEATVQNARAQLLRAQADMARVNDLVRDGSVSLRERDQTLASLRQAQAAVNQALAARTIAQQEVRTVQVGRGGLEAGVQGAQAALRLAQIDLANTVIRAPVDGQLGEVGVRRGQYVTAGTQLMAVVPRMLWVTANFKEAQTGKMRPGQRASFTVDALDGARLTGRVEQLAPAAGSEFAVIRPDNATGNFVKVPQRIAVRIRIDPNQPLADRLRPGMSVRARVEGLQ